MRTTVNEALRSVDKYISDLLGYSFKINRKYNESGKWYRYRKYSNHCLYTVHARRLLKTLLPAGLENS